MYNEKCLCLYLTYIGGRGRSAGDVSVMRMSKYEVCTSTQWYWYWYTQGYCKCTGTGTHSATVNVLVLVHTGLL